MTTRVAARYVRVPKRKAPAMDWRYRGACRTEDPELFFPTGTTGPAATQIEQAKAVCARCPVMETCREWALDTGQAYGVWGGTSEDERAAIQRRKYRKPSTGQKGETSCPTN